MLRCARGELPVNVALAQLFVAARDSRAARRALNTAIHHLQQRGHGERLQRLCRMRDLWSDTPDAFANVKVAARAVNHRRHGNRGRTTPGSWSRMFDRAVEATPDASVALYCLGRADLLRAATDEIVRCLASWHLLHPGCAVLDLGCGSGRLAEGLASRVGVVVGTDVSARMLEAARRRCRHVENAHVVRTSGIDLAAFSDACFDLVCALDVFPYFVISGLAQTHLREAARVLRPRGHLLIINYSYDSDAAESRRHLCRLAQSVRLRLLRFGTAEFALWDGVCFLLQKRP
ncbi:MAG TPA: class I SAM-dependent methyltransferase [Xanthobacteraceae bacterium]|nr:class I SAM-dependent methyltransferase [Xanthobacteraceae bacterium]